MIAELMIAALLLLGGFFALVGSVGLARLDDFYSRLHGPTKATTLGVGGMLAASAVFFSTRATGVSLHEVLVLLFLVMTAPVSAHLLARAALRLRVPSVSAPARDRTGFHDAGEAGNRP